MTAFLVIEAISYSSAGQALYRMVTVDSPDAIVPPLQFAQPPTGNLVTVRRQSRASAFHPLRTFLSV